MLYVEGPTSWRELIEEVGDLCESRIQKGPVHVEEVCDIVSDVDHRDRTIVLVPPSIVVHVQIDLAVQHQQSKILSRLRCTGLPDLRGVDVRKADLPH